MSEPAPITAETATGERLPDHLVLRDVRVFRGEHLRGDLHVVPEGLFLLREPPGHRLNPRDWFFRAGLVIGVFVVLFFLVSRLPEVPEWLAGAVSAAGTFALNWVLPKRRTRAPEPPWRQELAGVPLDEAVERLKGSLSLAWEETTKAVSSPGMVQLWHEEMRRTLILDLLPLARAALESAIRAHDIPIDEHREKPAATQRFTVSFEGSTWWRRNARLEVSPSCLTLEVRRGSSQLAVGAVGAVALGLFAAGALLFTLEASGALALLLWLGAVGAVGALLGLQEKIDRGDWPAGELLQRVTWRLEEISEFRVVRTQLWIVARDDTRVAVEIGSGQGAIDLIRTLALVAPERLVIEPGD